MSFELIMGFTKEIPSSVSSITFIVFMDLLMKYDKCGVHWFKTVRIVLRNLKICLFEPTCVSHMLTFVLPIAKYAKCVIGTNPVYSMSS